MKYRNISEQPIRLERHGETVEVPVNGEVLLAPALASVYLDQGILELVQPPAPRKTQAPKEVKSNE